MRIGRGAGLSVAALDRRKADQPPRWGYLAAILVSAAAHVGIAWFVLFILPGLWRQDFTPPTPYTVKVVDQIPAGDLGTRLPPLNDEQREAQEEKPPEENHEQAKPPEVKPFVKPPPPPPVENDKNAIALNATPVPSPPLKPTPTPTPTPEATPETTPAPAMVATMPPTEPPTPEETPEPVATPTPRPRPKRTPRPRPTQRPRPRATPHPHATPRSTPAAVRKPRPHPTPIAIAEAEPTPSVKQRIAELHRKLLETHLKELEEAEKEKASENPGSGPVVASHATEGRGYGVGPGTGSAGIEQDTEFLLYYRDVQQKIKDSWSFPGGSNDLTAIVTFGINPDGTLNGIKVNSSSNDPAFDESVVRAIKRAAPFLPPPAKYQQQFSAGVETTFKLGELKS